jgi:hypothetical protein
LLIRGAIPGSNNDYVVIRESKKLPKGSARAKRRLEIHSAPAEAAAPAGAKTAAAPAKTEAKTK